MTILNDYILLICREVTMKTMTITEFKTHALKTINSISKHKEGIVITKRGNPLARIIPFTKIEDDHKPGKLSNTLIYEKDIISPLDENDWEATQ